MFKALKTVGRYIILMGRVFARSSGHKNGCAEAGNVAPSKVTEKYKRNKYHEVNYYYGEAKEAYFPKGGFMGMKKHSKQCACDRKAYEEE